MVFRRVLSPAEARQLWSSSSGKLTPAGAKELSLPVKDGLVAYYPLDGDAEDKSKWENHGQVKGAVPVRDRFGKENGAFRFDGRESHVFVQDDVAIGRPAGLTVAAWVRNQGGGSIIRQAGDFPDLAPAFKGNSFRLLLDDRGNVVMYASGGRGNWTDPLNGITSQRGVPQDGKWHHVAGVFDKGDLRLYIDGQPDPARTTFYRAADGRGVTVPASLFTELADSTDSFWIGCGYGYRDRKTDTHFRGDLDDVAIYDRALTEEEIRTLASSKGTGQ
jgi:hypothetical protein